jgi:predicted transcriptional regulator
MGSRRRKPGRRPPGELERYVLAILWDAGTPLSPAEVTARCGEPLALTTIATILTRLYAKGVLRRTAHGRSYVYEPAVSRGDHVSEQVRNLLARGDRSVVLRGLLDGLSPDDEVELRKLLAKPKPGTRRKRRR